MNNRIPRHPIEPRKLLRNSVWRMDWENRQLLLYEADILYVLSTRQPVGIKIDFKSAPANVRKFILVNIVLSNKMDRFSKPYKTTVSSDTIARYPVLHNILTFTLKFMKNPMDLNDRITPFRYGKEDPVNENLRDKINYLIQNYK